MKRETRIAVMCLTSNVLTLLCLTLTGCYSTPEPAIDVTFRLDGQNPSEKPSQPLFRSTGLRQLDDRLEIYCAIFEIVKLDEPDRQIDRPHNSWVMRITAPRQEETARPRLCRIRLLRGRESRPDSANAQPRETLAAYEGEAYLQFQFEGRNIKIDLADFRLESVPDADEILFASGRVTAYRLPAPDLRDTWPTSFERFWATALDPLTNGNSP